MGNIWDVVGGIMISFGGAGAIILVIIKFSSNIIVDKLSKKYQHLLDEKLEAHKSVLDKKNYISKVRFDAEFAIYKSLWGTVIAMVFDNNALYPILDFLPPEKEDQKNIYMDRLKKAVASYNEANEKLQGIAPFIPKEIYEKFAKLRTLSREQIVLFQRYVLGQFDEKTSLFHDFKKTSMIYEKTESINKEQEGLISELRKYLSALEII